MIEYNFTDEQKKEIGETVALNWGDHMQSGLNEDGTPYLFTKAGPNLAAKKYLFYPNGEVTSEW